MKTEHRFAVALKAMMSEKPLDEISVLSICKKCKVNRQTFYYHFHDIYDLLTLIFLSEKIEDIDKTNNFNEMVKCIYRYYNKNEKFIEATLNSAGKELFSEFIYNACYQSTLRYINHYEIAKSLSVNDKKNIARFFANGYSYSIVYYLSNYKNKSEEGILAGFDFINSSDLLKMLQNHVKNKKK